MRYTQYYKMRIPEGPDYYDVEDFNNNTQTIDTELNRLKVMIGQAGSGAIQTTVTIPYSGWARTGEENLLTQTVSVPEIKADSIVLMGIPMGVDYNEFNAIIGARINAVSQGEGTITLRIYGYDPGRNISLSFVIM